MDALAAKLNLPKEPVYLPLDVQREVLLCAMERETYLCPKDNGKNMRNRAQLLSELSLVCRAWKEMADPLLYANVSLPTLTHLQRFTRTLAVHPDYGIWTRWVEPPPFPRPKPSSLFPPKPDLSFLPFFLPPNPLSQILPLLRTHLPCSLPP
ncbi:hypothetical protein BDY24DRAFT_227554 [Mrakia frigida]|uniref:uncharacterized protein n=1 Tax=Mrakia frigida TaxID=29902 RepID=UPI003FCBF2D3